MEFPPVLIHPLNSILLLGTSTHPLTMVAYLSSLVFVLPYYSESESDVEISTGFSLPDDVNPPCLLSLLDIILTESSSSLELIGTELPSSLELTPSVSSSSLDPLSRSSSTLLLRSERHLESLSSMVKSLSLFLCDLLLFLIRFSATVTPEERAWRNQVTDEALALESKNPEWTPLSQHGFSALIEKLVRIPTREERNGEQPGATIHHSRNALASYWKTGN